MSLTTEDRPIVTAILRNMPKGARGRRALEAEARKLTHDELREVVAFERYLAEEMEAGTDG
ncbi:MULTISPECIES: hypothetical protein [unclassified Aurantimonas]|uniref:hypothetical protein n=1 Tax=unclassified Aurantimonas TaxID=2638230 RepID=UPI002E182B77|nr:MULTISPECIES: hypothetical protein [unclassified Aurantimonas]MEC5289442.1 hypothetical protein [Aurantimonas sp. C2-3-R2]MEC5410522.1 hypothetical protein [Aurantimonas sp. C2-4-R8]